MLIQFANKIFAMKLLSDRVSHVLAATGISISDVARAVGIKPSAVSQWKSGETSNIRPEHLFKFADATGFEARWIGIGEGPERPPVAANHRLADLIHYYGQCDERGKDLVLRIAEREASYSTDQH
jgi:transcriptional regulator with XRE-family HTH domain